MLWQVDLNSVELKDSVRADWFLSDLIQEHVPQSDKILQLYDNKISHSEYLVKTNNFIIIAIGAFIVLIYLVSLIACIVIGVSPTTLPRRHIYTPCEKKYPPITLLVCALFVLLSASATLYYTVYFKQAYEESNCVLDTVLPKFKYGLNLPGSKFAGVESLISTSNLAVASFDNVTSTPTDFPLIIQEYTTTSQNLNTTLNTTLVEKYKDVQIPVPFANSPDTFQTDVFASWGGFQPDSNTQMGKLVLEMVPPLYGVLTNVEYIGQSTQTISAVQSELKVALQSASDSFTAFNTTNYRLHNLLTENQNYIDSSVDFSSIALYVLSSLLIVAMIFSVVAVMCVAFWPVGKRAMMLQIGWMFLGCISFLTCAVAVFMTFVTLGGGFPICNGYDTLFGGTSNLYAYPNIIPSQVADIYNECLYNYGASSTGRGNVVEGVVLRGTGDHKITEQTWQQVSNSLVTIGQNFIAYLTNKDNILFEGRADYADSLRMRVDFQRRKPSSASQQNSDPTRNSKTQFNRLNAMINAYVRFMRKQVDNSLQNTAYNCPSSVYTNDTFVEEDDDCPIGSDFYTYPPFWRSQDFDTPHCLRFSDWSDTQIFNRYDPRFSSCTNTDSGSTTTLGQETRDQYTAYKNFYDAVQSTYSNADTDIQNYQTELLSGASTYSSKFAEIDSYLFEVTPLIQSFANPKVGLIQNYECPLISQEMLEVYSSGCYRLMPYALNLSLLLWCSTVFAAICSCMGLAFVRRMKEGDDSSQSFI